MADQFSFPFRLDVTGHIALVDPDADDGRGERLAMLALTRKGDRALLTEFGVPDPTWEGFSVPSLAAQLARYAPDVRLEDVDVRVAGAGGLVVTVAYL